MNLWFRPESLLQNIGRIRFLGVRYDPLSEQDALARLLARDPKAGFAAVVTPNSDHLVRIRQAGGEIARAYDSAWLCLNDSRIVGFLARLMGLRLPTVPGANLVRSLFGSADFDLASPVLVVGATPATFATLVRRYGLTNATHFDAPMGLLKDRRKFDATVNFIENHPARFTFLSVGSPQQELLAQVLAARGKATGIGLCTGAAIDFLVYPHLRAPDLISKAGLEWLFRLLQEPRRLWRRYLISSPQVLALCWQEWRLRKQAGKRQGR